MKDHVHIHVYMDEKNIALWKDMKFDMSGIAMQIYQGFIQRQNFGGGKCDKWVGI